MTRVIAESQAVRQIRSSRLALLALVGTGLALLAFTFRSSGSFLVVDNRQRSDAVLITQGDSLDASYRTGIALLAAGYGRELLLDARTDRIFFGRSQAEWAREFIGKTATRFPGQVKVCPITADMTSEEVYQVENCLKGRSIRSVLLVVSDYHTRRSMAIFFALAAQVPLVDGSGSGSQPVRHPVVAEAGLGPNCFY